MVPSEPAARHRAIAAAFTERVAGVRDWDRPTPVAEWAARDVVRHLVEWLPPLLAHGAGIELPAGPPVAGDPAAAWRHHAAAVQAVLDDPARASTTFDHAPMPPGPVESAIDLIYTSDVFMHTWDLARATGQDDVLDRDECGRLLAGMTAMEDVIRSSGQFGTAVPVAEDADPQTRLLGFIGRDPSWRPPG